MPRRAVLWTCCALAAALAGCAESRNAVNSRTAEYRPRPSLASFTLDYSGYTEKQIDGSSWEITAYGNPHTDPARISLIAQVRAAELGKLNGFKYFKIASKNDKMSCAGYSTGSSTNYMSGAAESVIVARYSGEQAPEYLAVDTFLAENRARLDPVAANPEQEERIRLALRTLCRSQAR